MTKRERKERRWQKCAKKRLCKRLFGPEWEYAMQFDQETGKRVVFKARRVGLSTMAEMFGPGPCRTCPHGRGFNCPVCWPKHPENHCKGTQ